MKRFLWLGCVLFFYLICSGCGDTFRPIILPNPPTFPNPAATHTVVSINDNGAVVQGSAMVIDVSGDSVAGLPNVDVHPVHAVQQSGSAVLVLNQAVTGTGTATSPCLATVNQQVVEVCPSLTLLNFFGTSVNTSSIVLPVYSSPNFVAVAPSAATAYVTLPTYLSPTPPGTTIAPSVAAINTTTKAATIIPVGSTPAANPYALAVTPDNSKLYVANKGDGTIDAFNTQELSTRGINGSLSSPPIWLSARSDSQAVYVLETNGTLDYISITSSSGSDTLLPSTVSTPGATYMVYDGNKNKLYIPWLNQSVSPAQGELTIVDVSQSVPQQLATIVIPAFTSPGISGSVPAIASAVTVLPDESQAYVGSYAMLPTNISITSVSGASGTGTFAYTQTSGQTLIPGMSITVTGTDVPNVVDFDGTYIVSAIVSGTTACPGTCFQAPTATSGTWPPQGTTGPASGTGNNIFPQVTVVNLLSNTIAVPAIVIPGFAAYDAFCATTRFRLTMAAAGDSSRAYLASCDGGMVNIILTATESYIENQPAPASTRNTSPPGPQNFPQNPLFLLAGP